MVDSMKLSNDSYIKSGLLFMLVFSVTSVFCGEESQEDLQEEYTELRQALLDALTLTNDQLRVIRRQFPTQEAFDRAMTTQTLNQILENLPQNARNIVHPLFMILHSPTSWILHIQYVLKFLHNHPYDEVHGEYLIGILDRYRELAHDGAALLANYSQSIQTAQPNQIQAISIMYMIEINRLQKEITKLLNDMALID